MLEQAPLESTRAFWDANPCGVHGDYTLQREQRYAMEPWLPGLLERIAARHVSLFEVGCGQGVDSIQLCTIMRPGGRYAGIDYSPLSIERAKANARLLDSSLRVKPEYKVGNAEALEFSDSSFEAVYSMGVLHHTADEAAAVREILRVLKPGGKAYVCLYRRPAPKVAVAKLLRGVQRSLDLLLGTDRCIYQMLRRQGTSSRLFGTMFHECFGVPYMKWYSRKEIEALFVGFTDVDIISIGANLGRMVQSMQPTLLGYFWLIEATK